MLITREKEIWITLKHYKIKENKYLISSLGRIKEKDTNKEIIHSIYKSKRGTHYVNVFTKEDVLGIYAVHILMAYSFYKLKSNIGAIDILFKNNNKDDLFIGNITYKDKSLFNSNTVHNICSLLEQNYTAGEIINELKLKNTNSIRTSIRQIKNGLIHKSISSQYQI